ncbi:MAG: ABC transporter ATP-binding protein [Lachnospiraceae bacterium]|nr:ABC transporter ATP-binding protein [Lachnospiraceae bacterium]
METTNIDLVNKINTDERPIAISVEHVSKVYKLFKKPADRVIDAMHLAPWKKVPEHHALNDVSFQVQQGEMVGIIGTNGSGKSTILKIITGVLHPTKGEVKVNGRISALLELGAGFNREYTGIENIYLNGTMIGFSKEEIDAKLQDILDFADIGDFVYQPVKTYSSGMFVRLAFAVAINIEPEILIVDEALAVGDVFFQAKCYRKFDEFKKMGKTILFVSHDLSSIVKYCDRVVLLNKGTKLGEGKAKEMIDVYKQVLVGQYNEEGNGESGETNANIDQGANPELLEYGSKKAEITECYITDNKGKRTNALIKGESFTIHMKAAFAERVQAPIFAFTIKNAKGTEITGTNTMFEKAFMDAVGKGVTKEVTFTQKMDLQGGDYLLSLGLTGYEGSDFTVYHRLYDAMNITVISDKDTVGFYDMNSKVDVKDAGKRDETDNIIKMPRAK